MSNTQQSIINFQLPFIINYQETTQYMMNVLKDNNNNIIDDLQFTFTIKDYNQNATAKLDVVLIITDLEKTNRPPTTKEKKDTCTIYFGNYNYENNIYSLTCNHKFYFHVLINGFVQIKVVKYIEKIIYDLSLITIN
ncbi:hypothetical protein N665_0134s0012 [Sinapis alba]|nr:hypothetical protein N665_0134s0012 [Sinapis alba]